jgi:hypothetical protein
MINILHNLALFWVKNANFFAEFFDENILKIITSVPGKARYEFGIPGGIFIAALEGPNACIIWAS